MEGRLLLRRVIHIREARPRGLGNLEPVTFVFPIHEAAAVIAPEPFPQNFGVLYMLLIYWKL